MRNKNHFALMLIITFFVLAGNISVFAQSKNTVNKSTSISVDNEEALKAFNYINEIRANPAKYSQEIGVNLNGVKPKPALKWNDTLAKVAQERAADLAKRNYFSHVNPDGEGVNILIFRAGYKLPEAWIKDKRTNNFESLQAGAIDGKDAVKDLIIDEGESRIGHRKHLLGIDDWNASLKDIGIGFVRAPGSEYKTYVCIIIAKHNW